MKKSSNVYIRCPRCELNYCLKKEKFCSVCKSEMKAGGSYDEDNDFDTLDLELCPFCKTNYIKEDETMCSSCARQQAIENNEELSDKEDEWKTYVYEKDDLPEKEYDEDLTVTEYGEEDDILDDEDIDLDLNLALDEDLDLELDDVSEVLDDDDDIDDIPDDLDEEPDSYEDDTDLDEDDFYDE